MTLTQLVPPYPIFTDRDGSPLDAGYLYFGEPNLNPETNPIQVYYDPGLTQPLAQPLRTANGYVMRNGSPALIYADGQFSVTVRNKKNELVIYSPVGFGITPSVPFAAFENAARDVSALLTGTQFTYLPDIPNTIQVIPGYILRTLAEGFAYDVAASTATDQHVTTAGGVKLYVQISEDGSVRDTQFGLVDDPTEAVDQSAPFTKFFQFGGSLIVTAGNKYYIPSVSNIITTRSTSVRSSENGKTAKLIGSGIIDGVTSRIIGGNLLFRPAHNLEVAGCELTLFDTVFNGTNGVSVDTINFNHNHIHHCDFFARGNVQAEYLIVTNNRINDLPAACVLLDSGSNVNKKQIVNYNYVRDIVRYFWRGAITDNGDMEMIGNDIRNLTFGSFVGSASVARVLMRCPGQTVWVNKNRVENVISNDGNSNFIYWSETRNLVVTENVFGYFSGGTASGGYIFDEKSTLPKSIMLAHNRFITTDGNSTAEIMVQRLTNSGVGGKTTIVDNHFNKLTKGVLFLFNNLYDNLDGKPDGVIVARNTFEEVEYQNIVHIVGACGRVQVSDNVIRKFSNPDGVEVSSETRKCLVFAIVAGQPTNPQVFEQVVCSGNQIAFSQSGESPPSDSAIVMLSSLSNVDHAINCIVDNNIVSGAQGFGMRRNNVGKLRVAMRNNVSIDGVINDFNSAEAGTELDFFVSAGNINSVI